MQGGGEWSFHSARQNAGKSPVPQAPRREADNCLTSVVPDLLEELASEKRWDGAFASSQQQLSSMAREALREFEAGQTLPSECFSNASWIVLTGRNSSSSLEGSGIWPVVRFYARTVTLNRFTASLSRLLGLGELSSRK
jgi:hypothetical protein